MKVNLLKKTNALMYLFILSNNTKKKNMVKSNDEDEIKLHVFY